MNFLSLQSIFAAAALITTGIAAGAPTTSEIQYLSGTDKDNTVPWDFRVSAGRNAGVWTTIPVPSCWETKGFGSYEYGGINTSEYGEYKKAFNVPAEWADKRVFLVFEGSMTDTETRINGLAPGAGGAVPAPDPLSNERALDNRASAGPGQSGGIAASASGNLNLGTLSSFTLACWVKPEADFGTLPENRFPRLMLLGANAGYDGGGDGAYLSVFNSGANTRALQFKVPGIDLISSPNVLSGNDWTFVAVTYDSTVGSNHVKFYVGNRSGALGSPVSTGGSAGGSVPFGSAAFASLLNRSGDRGRAFDGLGDDFRIFNSALSQAQLETVRASGLDAAVSPPAPLYHWNFNNASTGTTVAPVTGAGGILTLQDSAGSATDLYSPIDGGVSSVTLSNERALDNRATTSMGQGGGVAASTSGDLNLGTLTSFTMACWVKPEADFNSMPDLRFPRLMLLGENAGYDGSGNGAYLSVFNTGANTRALEFKTAAGSVISSPNVLSGSDWTFVVVTYDSTLGSDHVKFYVGNRTGALGGPVSTATHAAGSVTFGTSAFASLLNRSSDHGRAFDGLGDDFRIFNGALTQAQLETVRTSGLGTNVTSPTPLYHWNFNNASTGTSVAPVVGTGGVLTLQNSAGTATDLYSPVGDGVSSGAQTVPATVVHQGGFYEFSYDVTSNLNFGASNLLEVTVRKKSANSSVNDAERIADYWTFGGIYRPVYLEARPATHIERVAVDPKANGQITVNTFLSGVTSPCTVAARVTDMNDVALGSEFTAAAATSATSAVLSTTLPTPNPWSPEFPNLYKLTVEIRDGTTVLHSRTETIGFRTIGFVANSGFTLNGKKILMRGVNRHEFWPTDGRTTSRALSIADIELMKIMNMNAVRMSHYPPSKHFLEECDRLGLLVLDELAGWQGAYDNVIGPDLVREMVIRDVNHPCILAWNNGNEGGSNGTLDDDFALWDPQNRKVLHPANWGTELTGGVRTHHYADYNTFLSYLGAGQPVYMPTEMQHGLFDGGGGAGLADHWNAMRTAPNGGGMFIWALLDEGLVRGDQGGAIDTWTDNAPDGIVGPYREKEASYYTVKALWSPVQITAPNPATFSGSLAVENRFDFTHLNQCTFHWDLGWFPDPADSTEVQDSGFIVGTSSTNFAGPSVASGTSGTLALGVPANLASYDALRVSAKDPFGKEIYTWTWPLHSITQVRDRLVHVSGGANSGLTPSVNGSVLSVTNGTRVWQFDLTTGRLNGVTVSGQPVSLSNGPRPVSGTWTTSGVTHGFDGSDYLVTMNDVTSASNGFQWRIHPNGWVNLKYRYTLTGTQTWLGVTFDYPEANVTGMRWLGQGPYRVWKNRMEGQEIGVNYKAANNNVNGTQWGFPEFRGYHGQLYWAQLGTTQQPITLTTNTSNLFLRVLTPTLTPPFNTWRTSVIPAFPAGNLSLLHAINAIGNKFQAPDPTKTGPSSADTTATGLYEGDADFYFGTLPDPGVDRDANSLGDSWELQHFNSLGNDPAADPDGDGLKLLLENTFDLSPSVPDAGSPRLPHMVAPGTISPAAMVYSVPLARLNEFNYVPEISDSLIDWCDQAAHPDYFQMDTSDLAGERQFTLEHGPSWPGDTGEVFLRLRIDRK